MSRTVLCLLYVLYKGQGPPSLSELLPATVQARTEIVLRSSHSFAKAGIHSVVKSMQRASFKRCEDMSIGGSPMSLQRGPSSCCRPFAPSLPFSSSAKNLRKWQRGCRRSPVPKPSRRRWSVWENNLLKVSVSGWLMTTTFTSGKLRSPWILQFARPKCLSRRIILNHHHSSASCQNFGIRTYMTLMRCAHPYFIPVPPPVLTFFSEWKRSTGHLERTQSQFASHENLVWLTSSRISPELSWHLPTPGVVWKNHRATKSFSSELRHLCQCKSTAKIRESTLAWIVLMFIG